MKFKLIKKLAKSPSSTVYSAKYQSTSNNGKQSVVAIKITPKAKKEKIIKLKHDNLVEIYEYIEDNVNCYLIMELCDYSLYDYVTKSNLSTNSGLAGGENSRCISTIGNRNDRPISTITTYTNNNGSSSSVNKISEELARFILIQIVNGLIYLQSHNIIHRDIKLSNILLKNGKVKIGDFGLCCVDESGETQTDINLGFNFAGAEGIVGTPNYISPEVLKEKKSNKKSDVWSLGCLLYTLLTGTPPFQADSIANTLNRVVLCDYYLPSWLSDDVCDLIRKMLKEDVNLRISLEEILCHEWFVGKKWCVLFDEKILLERLSGCKHVSKYASFEVGNNKMVVDFGVNNKNQNSSRREKDLMVVDVNGLVWFSKVFDEKKYFYAYKFLQALRAKVVKLEFISSKERGLLYENGDFEYFDLTTNKSGNGGDKLRISIDGVINSNDLILTNKAKELFKKVKVLEKKCSKFPYVYREKSDYLKHDSNNNLDNTFGSTVNTVSRAGNTFNMGTSTYCSNTFPSLINSSALNSTNTNAITTANNNTGISDISHFNNACNSNSIKHIPSVGWCIIKNDCYWLLFDDGVRLVIESFGKDCYVEYYSANSNKENNGNDTSKERYLVSKKLPVHVKEKLGWFVEFVKKK